MEKKISGQDFYVNMYVFTSDGCNVALTYQEQLFTHATAQETPSDKKSEPFSLSAQSRDFLHCYWSSGLSSQAFLASCCCFQGWSTVIPALFYFLMWGWDLVLPGNDSSVVVDPPQVLTRAARDRHLHCTGYLHGAGAGLCRLSLLLWRLEPAYLNFIHIMVYNRLKVFFCDKSLRFYFIPMCTL